ncbi:unnamed protein product [Staurois parvus]|uniref:Uncharacterized protein n=1 Tax=Staurois parvus TaxID=386267 RepID=A0ABN9ARM8_9NEOB|nr:unnamed protein product [Staurois parvus]
MKSPLLGPCFESSQRADCTGVCRPFCGGQAMILGSTPADRSQEGSTLADRRYLPWSQVGFTKESGQLCARAIIWEESAGDRH